jgi:hypothetical protein
MLPAYLTKNYNKKFYRKITSINNNRESLRKIKSGKKKTVENYITIVVCLLAELMISFSILQINFSSANKPGKQEKKTKKKAN